jgi:hypothetical protein
VRKLESDKKALKEENESLMKKVRELEKLERGEPFSARQPVCLNSLLSIKHL